MTKTLLTILLTLLLVGCGGAPFDGFGDLPAGAGGEVAEAGSAGVVAGGSEAQVGGSAGAAGSHAGGSVGIPQGGTAPVAGGSAGAAGSSASAGTAGTGSVCVLDRAKITANLPSIVTWDDFSYASGDVCARCAGSHCLEMSVPSWGQPTEPAPGELQYSISDGAATVAIGKSSGNMCTEQTQCMAQLASITWTLHVVLEGDHWRVTDSAARIFFQDNMCLETAASGVAYQMGVAFEKDFGAPLVDLQIPCK